VSERAAEPSRDSITHGHGLQVIMRSAMRGAQGDFALVALRVDGERLMIHAGIGPLAEDMVGNLMLVRDSVAAPVLLGGKPLLVQNYPYRGAAPPGVRVQIGSVIVVPLVVRERPEGALAIGRLAGRPGFGEAELDELFAFVQRTGTARELDGAREERRMARLVEERGRIRDDLHDNVIQELFAAGMALQAVANRISDAELRQLVIAQIDALDGTTHRIRSLISDIPATGVDAPALPLAKRLVAIVDSLTPALRCLPTVAFAGPVESAVHAELAQDLEAVLREALSNVARHADASSVQISIGVTGERLVLHVIDNGCGIGAPARSSGLANMRRRAARHDGVLEVTTPAGGGTHLSWNAAAGEHSPQSDALSTGRPGTAT
jgi:signal transduction histidine kinase